ncbi:MAG: hypothetical protein JXM79_18550 [Sedimentisphaerales bacterium]|nr:hypothetical protein [Sedimentisphaerales bacterium]
MKVTHFIYQWEREAVRLRYDEGLCRIQIADRLSLRFAQVKYIFSKVNVKHFIQMEIEPRLWRQELAEIEEKLADPMKAYVDFLIERTEAQTYQWFGPGRKVYYSNNMARFRANQKLGRILRITGDQKTFRRDFRNAVQKHIEKLHGRRNILQAHLAFVHKN